MESPLTAGEIKLRDKTLRELGELMRVMDNPNSTVFEIRVKTRATLDLLAKLDIEFLQKLTQSRTSSNLLPPSPAAFWRSRPSNSCQEKQTVLNDNIVYLVQHTSNWSVLKPLLLQSGLLSEPEIEDVEHESNNESKHYLMFTTIAKKKNWIEKVTQCLKKSQNEHVADVILAAQNKLLCDHESSENNARIGRDTLKEILKTHASNIQDYESTRVTMDNNRADLDNQIEITKKEKRKLEIKVELLTNQLRDAMDAEINSTYELECLQNKIQALNAEKQDLDMQLTQCNLRIETLNAQLSDQTEQLAKNEIEMRELQSTKAELEQRLVQLESAHQIEKENANKSNENLLELLELKHSAQILEFSRQISALQKRKFELECGIKERPVPPKKPLLRCSTQSSQQCTDVIPSVIVAKAITSEAKEKNFEQLKSNNCPSREIEKNHIDEVWGSDLDQDRAQIQKQQNKLAGKIKMFELWQIGGSPMSPNDPEITPNPNQLPPSSEQNSIEETETEMDIDFEQIVGNSNGETTTEIQNTAKNESEDQIGQRQDSDDCVATTSVAAASLKEKNRMFESQQIVIKPRAQDFEFIPIQTPNDESLEHQPVECVEFELCLEGDSELFQPLQHNICENLSKLELENFRIEPRPFLNSIRPCKSITSIQLIRITLTEHFEEIIDLPSLREYKLELLDENACLPIQNYTSLLFWAKVNDFEFNTLANLNVDIVRIKILRDDKYLNPRAEFDRHNCKYVKWEASKNIDMHSCSLHEPKVDVQLKHLDLRYCSIHSSCIPSNLTSLTLCLRKILGGTFDDVLKSMHNLIELTFISNERTLVNMASIPIDSLCTVQLTNIDFQGQVKGLKEGRTGPPLRCPRKWYLHLCAFDRSSFRSFPNLLKDATHLNINVRTVDGESDATIVHEVLKIQSLEFLDVDICVNLKRLANLKSELSKYPMFENKLNDIGKHSSQNFFLYFKLSKTAGKWNCLDLYTANSLEIRNPDWWFT